MAELRQTATRAPEYLLRKFTCPDSLHKILAEEYFAKPMHAVARSFELAAYASVQLDFAHPVLDLGCGTGAFASVFCRFRGLDKLDFGTEPSIKNLRQASRRRIHNAVFQSDGRALPVKNGTIKLVLCNGVLCCIANGYGFALREVARVLDTDGQFVMTVPTPNFTAALLPTRLLEKLRFYKLSQIYSERVNARHGHRKLADLESWQRELQRVGLRVESHVYYFDSAETALWSVLAMRPFQLFAILKYLPRSIQGFAAAFTERLVRSVTRLVSPREKDCGYLLIVARKV